MAFDGPEDIDYHNVSALNGAYLSLLKENCESRGSLRSLSAPLLKRITSLNRQQIERLSATPFLLLSFRESDDEYWNQVLSEGVGRDLFTPSAADEIDTLISAGLGFMWQLARQNPFALRLICGAHLHWCEQIADQTFFGLLTSVAARGGVLQLRRGYDHELWQKLLDSGTSRESGVRTAAHMTALQTILTRSPKAARSVWASAACRSRTPSLRVADDADN